MAKEDTLSKPWKQGWKPAVFDLAAYFEPSAYFEHNRGKRKQFDGLVQPYKRSTWMLGRYGGTPRLRTDLQGLGVATRIEVGRLAWSPKQRRDQLSNAFGLFLEAQRTGLASGPVDRILADFSQAASQPNERHYLSQAWTDTFGGADCAFLARTENQVELGQCVVYQPLLQYLREDGVYHQAHRRRIEAVGRHLQEDVGRYENHRFFVRPIAVPQGVPLIHFCYTGPTADPVVEAFVEGYTGEKLAFVGPETFQREQATFVSLKDYERASRRFGGLWVQVGDMVQRLAPELLALLHLFLDPDLKFDLDRTFSWETLVQRQCTWPQIDRAARQSGTFLEGGLEGLVRSGLVQQREGGFCLHPDFPFLRQVYFYSLGEHRKRAL